jgi:hypothetical protein
MSRNYAFMLTMLVVMAAGCTSTRREADAASLRVPMELGLGAPGSPAGPVRIRSGQVILVGPCCPPLELRDASGKVIRELDFPRQPLPLVVRPGSYSIVGHDPEGNERGVRIAVTGD